MEELDFCSDVEGNMDYFEKYIARSPVLRWDSKGDLDLAHDRAHFVYGGDVLDKAPGDLRLTRLLVGLKRRYPDRVVLIVGNRDLNKLRLTSELAADDMARPVDEIPIPFWDPNALPLKEFLARKATESGKSLAEVNTRAERLRWILAHTMGSPGAFEFRRQELALLGGAKEVSDEAVVDSYVSEVQPGGAMRDYLQLGQIAALLGNTLVVHGAIDSYTYNVVPTGPAAGPWFRLAERVPPMREVASVREWVDEHNRMLRESLTDHDERPTWDAARGARGGEFALAIQCRPAMMGRAPVAACYSDGGNIHSEVAAQHLQQSRPQLDRGEGREAAMLHGDRVSDPRDERVAAWLRAGGVRRVMVGHRPSGDSPAVLSAQYTGVEVVSADISYSDTRAADMRGCAIAVVTVRGPSLTDNATEVSGVLRDGREHKATLGRLHDDGGGGGGGEGEGDRLVGMELDGGWWVKTALAGANSYLLCKGGGRSVEYRDAPQAEAQEMYERRPHQ